MKSLAAAALGVGLLLLWAPRAQAIDNAHAEPDGKTIVVQAETKAPSRARVEGGVTGGGVVASRAGSAQSQGIAEFNDLQAPRDSNAPIPPTRDQVEAVARQSVLRMTLPTPAPRVGPDPNANEWKKSVVGFPLWLWVDGPRTMAASSGEYGIVIQLNATLRDVHFVMGDGGMVRCAAFTPYPVTVEPATPSPTCGYAYQREPRSGSYQVTATATWDVQWSALGYSGTVVARVDDTRQLPVTSLQSVVVR